MKRASAIAAILAIAAALFAAPWGARAPRGVFTAPDGANVTFFPAPQGEAGLPLVISASIEAGFMRPFLLAFQRRDPTLSIAYIQSRGGAFLHQAIDTCRRDAPAADLYLSASTDQLVRLANEGCARPLPAAIGLAAPAQAQWRNEVVAFTVEPAAFVFARPVAAAGPVPASHIALLDWLRSPPAGGDRIGTYDIEESAEGYDFAASDSRQAALYGRLIEGLGRADVRLYCCSNVMVDAVDRGDIGFAYNVQLSYAYAAQRAGSRILVVVPGDYQALQTLSLMVPRNARREAAAARLAAFLVSDEARTLARRALAPPGQARPGATAHVDQLLAHASVTPVLLSLQDPARRERLIHEWRQAIVRPASQTGADGAGRQSGAQGKRR